MVRIQGSSIPFDTQPFGFQESSDCKLFTNRFVSGEENVDVFHLMKELYP